MLGQRSWLLGSDSGCKLPAGRDPEQENRKEESGLSMACVNGSVGDNDLLCCRGEAEWAIWCTLASYSSLEHRTLSNASLEMAGHIARVPASCRAARALPLGPEVRTRGMGRLD